MSGPLAFAAVTAVLKDLLNDGLVNSDLSAVLGTVKVTALPPDRIATGAEEPNGLNLFLYQVTPNQGWRNVGLPSRSSGGDQSLSNPPLAVDLHYLLTAYGAQDLDAEVLLGYAMQLLHERPVLTRAMIRRTFSESSPVTDRLMPESVEDRNAADLADQLELCKVTPRYLNADELSKLWSAMQARYRPTMAYTVSTVLIERKAPVKTALPVRAPRLHVLPMARPFIDRIEPPSSPVGATVRIIGSSLRGSPMRVRVGGTMITPEAGAVSDERISLTLPATLRAGINPVQVVHEVPLGEPPAPRHGVGTESNVGALVVTPAITSPSPHTAARDADFTVTVSPPVGRDQRAAVLIGEQAVAVPQRPPDADETSATLAVHIPDSFAPGTYLLRVQVDGATSALLVDEDPSNATFNQYVGPTVTIT